MKQNDKPQPTVELTENEIGNAIFNGGKDIRKVAVMLLKRHNEIIAGLRQELAKVQSEFKRVDEAFDGLMKFKDELRASYEIQLAECKKTVSEGADIFYEQERKLEQANEKLKDSIPRANVEGVFANAEKSIQEVAVDSVNTLGANLVNILIQELKKELLSEGNEKGQ